MPTLRQDSTLNEYNFTLQEKLSADILSAVQICRLQTRYAELTKQKAAMLAPMKADDREWMCEVAEIDGKMNMIQELFANHQEAMKAMADPATAAEFAMKGTPGVDDLMRQQRAASGVHGTNPS